MVQYSIFATSMCCRCQRCAARVCALGWFA